MREEKSNSIKRALAESFDVFENYTNGNLAAFVHDYQVAARLAAQGHNVTAVHRAFKSAKNGRTLLEADVLIKNSDCTYTVVEVKSKLHALKTMLPQLNRLRKAHRHKLSLGVRVSKILIVLMIPPAPADARRCLDAFPMFQLLTMSDLHSH